MSHTVLKLMEINISVLGVARWVRSPPQGERLKCYSRLDMNPDDACKTREIPISGIRAKS